MYILLIAFGIVLLMHSFLLVAVLRKNEELSRKVNALRRSIHASSLSGKKRMNQSNLHKHAQESKKRPGNPRSAKGERTLQ